MKKLLFRKLLLSYMSFFLIALLSSSIVIWVFQAVNYLDIMIEDGRDYLIYINYSLLNFPKIFSKLSATEGLLARIDDKLSRIKKLGFDDPTKSEDN